MIIGGGKTQLGHQGVHKKMQSSNDESNSFQDILVGAHKKKFSSKEKTTKAYDQKKKSNNDVYDDGQQVSQRRENPVKKQEKPQEAKQVSKSNDKINQVGSGPKTSQYKESKVIDSEVIEAHEDSAQSMDAMNMTAPSAKKFSEMVEESKQNGSSINLSGIDNKTLQENQKNLSAENEASIEEMLKDLNQQLDQLSGSQKQAQGAVQIPKVNPYSKGQIKLDPEMKISQGGETLALNSENDLNPLKALSQEPDAQTDQSASDLDQLFNQYLDQDLQNNQVDGAGFADEMAQVQKGEGSEKIENMQSIIKQARAFVDDGGGSMEIHLQPEGLGKVHLKVAVHEGQVNVEMLTDNASAKKALEDGLFDIKNALEGQKLLVETLKVEMSPDYQKDFSDLSNQMQEQANRDFAQEFLGQFKQEREARFGGMFNSFKNFNPAQKEPDLTLRANPYSGSGKGRSINLVA